MKNIAINVLIQALFWYLIAFGSEYSEAIAAFRDMKPAEQLVVGFILVLAGFIWVSHLIEDIQADGKITRWERIKFYSSAIPFVIADGFLNVVAGPWLLIGSIPNSRGEGWLFTNHCTSIKHYTEFKMMSGVRPNFIEWIRYWLCENFYGEIMNAVQKGHYK